MAAERQFVCLFLRRAMLFCDLPAPLGAELQDHRFVPRWRPVRNDLFLLSSRLYAFCSRKSASPLPTCVSLTHHKHPQTTARCATRCAIPRRAGVSVCTLCQRLFLPTRTGVSLSHPHPEVSDRNPRRKVPDGKPDSQANIRSRRLYDALRGIAWSPHHQHEKRCGRRRSRVLRRRHQTDDTETGARHGGEGSSRD